MWYPFKFWRNVGYVYVTGRLAELCGQAGRRPKRRTLRAIDRAKKADGDYLLAVPGDDWRFVAIEHWATRPDHSFRSMTARFVDDDGRDMWVETSIGHRPALELLAAWAWPENQSPFEGIATMAQGRAVTVAYPAGQRSEPPQVDRTTSLTELLSG